MNCLRDVCDLEVYSRGLCQHHYHQCRYAIATKQTNWNELETLGLALPKNSAGRKKKQSEIQVLLAQARAKNGAVPKDADA